MSVEDLQQYESEVELDLYRQYREVAGLFRHIVETERRFYLANDVDVQVRATEGGEVFFEVHMRDVWVWDMYRTNRFARSVRVLTFKDVNVEDLPPQDVDDGGR